MKNDKKLKKRCRIQAEKECAIYDHGICILDERPCHVINPDGAVDCKYFLDAVLPLDAELNTAIWREINHEEEMTCKCEKACVHCHKPFIPASNSQKYCKACSEEVKKQQAAARQRQKYWKNK